MKLNSFQIVAALAITAAAIPVGTTKSPVVARRVQQRDLVRNHGLPASTGHQQRKSRQPGGKDASPSHWADPQGVDGGVGESTDLPAAPTYATTPDQPDSDPTNYPSDPSTEEDCDPEDEPKDEEPVPSYDSVTAVDDPITRYPDSDCDEDEEPAPSYDSSTSVDDPLHIYADTEGVDGGVGESEEPKKDGKPTGHETSCASCKEAEETPTKDESTSECEEEPEEDEPSSYDSSTSVDDPLHIYADTEGVDGGVGESEEPKKDEKPTGHQTSCASCKEAEETDTDETLPSYTVPEEEDDSYDPSTTSGGYTRVKRVAFRA